MPHAYKQSWSAPKFVYAGHFYGPYFISFFAKKMKIYSVSYLVLRAHVTSFDLSFSLKPRLVSLAVVFLVGLPRVRF